MAASSLLTLIDDIASLLDDVAAMSKVAARKTAGVLGDDLALNAQQVTGVNADRELPVVWAVARGSFINKLILVPLALLISAFVPVLVTPLLMLGGAFLCFEGCEKLMHAWLHDKNDDARHHENHVAAISNPDIDMVAFEKDKIRGAIRTDFILSAEIIVISLGTVAQQSFEVRLGVLVAISLVMTVGVYGLVAGIVKLDDAGLWLVRRARDGGAALYDALGRALLAFAPVLMKLLSVAGTVAMFLVGGGILVHGLPFAHGWGANAVALVAHWPLSSVWSVLLPSVIDGLAGVVVGAIIVALVQGASRAFGGSSHESP